MDCHLVDIHGLSEAFGGARTLETLKLFQRMTSQYLPILGKVGNSK